jgi:hypothetical protein
VFKRSLSIGFVLASFLNVAPVLAAGDGSTDENLTADTVVVKTPSYRPEDPNFNPPLGTYTYTTSWEGIPAATLTVSISHEGKNYRVISTAKTARAIDLFYKLRYRGEGLVLASDFTPIKSIFNQTENSKERNTQITYMNDGDILAVRSEKGKDAKVLRFNPHNMTLDPFSASLLARSLNWEVGQTREFDTFNGKSRYLLSLTAEDKVKMRVNGEDKEVWVIVPHVSNLTSKASDKKLRSAKIYVTADNSRDVLKIVSSVFVGSVTTSLDGFEPESVPAGTQMANKEHHVFVE